MGSQREKSLKQFAEAIREAASMLDGFPLDKRDAYPTDAESLPSLLEQCKTLYESVALEGSEPIRTIHHFACTGGSLISKCIAAMPNTKVLSEVDPLSTVHVSRIKPRFTPTDLIQRIRDTGLGDDDNLVGEMFLSSLAVVHEWCNMRGIRLVLRDHTHSHFCSKADYSARTSVGRLLSDRFPLISVITVRHPLDSYLSMRTNKWIDFSPSSLDEYSRRYLAFLDSYPDTPVFKYEDFVHNPKIVMAAICEALRLPFDEQFLDSFMVIQMTGDSGRTSDAINPRPRRKVPEDVSEEMQGARVFQELLSRLGYD